MWNCGISLRWKELLPNCSLNEKSWKSLQVLEDTLVIDLKGSAAPNLSHLPPVSKVIHSGSFNFCNFVAVSQVHSSALLLCLVLVTHFYLLVVLRVEMLTVKKMLRWNLSKNKFINLPPPLTQSRADTHLFLLIFLFMTVLIIQVPGFFFFFSSLFLSPRFLTSGLL